MDAEAELSGRPSAQDARCVVLVFAGDAPVGCGFAVSVGDRRLLLTCAHVVNAALGRQERDVEFPDATLTVAPWFAREERSEARVLAGGWFPILPDGGGDIALLEPLGPPPRIAPAPLRPWGARPALSFQVFGFPAGYKLVGQHAVGVMTGGFGPRGQWVQLDGETSRGARITRGFSGSAVWDISTQTVVGMVVAEDIRDTASACGAMLPIEVVGELAAPVREALPVIAHPLAALARHVGPLGELPLVREVPASAIGATPTAYSRQPGGGAYVERDVDADLRRGIETKVFALVVGPSKAGKTRTAWEAARVACADYLLLEPRDRSALVHLVSEDAARVDGRRVLVWLDELERFWGREGERGLDLDLLRLAARRAPPWRIVGSIRDEHYRHLYGTYEGLGADWRRIDGWEATETFLLPGTLSERERVDAALAYPDEDFRGGVGIGERLIAGPELLRRLDSAENPVGWALAWAAIDWARTGLEGPAYLDDLIRLAGTYLRARFPLAEYSPLGQAIDWLAAPVASHVSLATVEQREERFVVRPLDYIVAAADGQGSRPRQAVAAEAWSLAVERTEGRELLAILAEALRRHDDAGKFAAAAKAWQTLHGEAAVISAEVLGNALVKMGRVSEALGPLRQAVDEGDEAARAHALHSLAGAFRRLGDHVRAVDAYRQVIASGHDHMVDSALIDLGEFYRELGDDESAMAIYESACVRPDPGIVALGWIWRSSLLRGRGELRAAAAAAFEFALVKATAIAWLAAGNAAAEANQGESAGKCFANAIEATHDRPDILAEAAYQRAHLLQDDQTELAETVYRTAIDRGAGRWADASALTLAGLVRDVPERVELLERAVRSEDSAIVARALLALARVHLEQDEPDAALAAAERCAQFDLQLLGRQGVVGLAQVFSALDRRDVAVRCYEQARTLEEASPADDATLGLARLRIELGALTDAVDLLRSLANHPSAPVAARAGELLGEALLKLGELEPAFEAYRAAADRPGPEGRSARERLGLKLWEAGRPQEALEALEPLLDDSDERLRAHANDLTGVILKQNNPQVAAAAFRRVIDTGHTHCLADAHFYLGAMAQDSDDLETAVDHYRASVEISSGLHSAQAALKLAMLLPDLGQRGEAINLLTEALPQLEVGGRLAFTLGVLLHNEGHLNRALLRYEDALSAAEASGDEEIVGLAGRNVAALAEYRHDTGAYEDALRRVLAAGDLAASAAAALDLARWKLNSADYAEAQRLVRITIDKDDDSTLAQAWILLADLLRIEGRTTDAFTALSRAEQADGSGSLLAQIELTRGAFAFDTGELDTAEAAFKRASSLGTAEATASAAFDLALVRWERGDTTGAEMDLRTLMSSDVHAIAHMSALTLAEKLEPEDTEAALTILEELAQSEPLCLHAHQAAVSAGGTRLERRDHSQARRLFERGVAGPVPALAEFARLGLAELDHESGDTNGAIEGLRALADSEDEEIATSAQTKLGALFVEIGRLDEAEATLLPLVNARRDESRDELSCAYGEFLLRRGRHDESRRWLLHAADSDNASIRNRASGLLDELRTATS